MQLGLYIFFIAVSGFVFGPIQYEKCWQEERRIESCVETLTRLSEFEVSCTIGDGPNPRDFIQFSNQIQTLGNEGATEAMNRFCDRFPIEDGDRTLLLDWLIPFFWTSNCDIDPESFFLPEWHDCSHDVSPFSWREESHDILAREPFGFALNVITVVDGIPFENRFYARLGGPQFESRKNLVEWVRSYGKLKPIEFSPPDDPVAVLEKATTSILGDFKRRHAQWVLRVAPLELRDDFAWQEEECWTKAQIRDHLCSQLYKLMQPASSGLEAPQRWYDREGKLDKEFRILEGISKTVYWDKNSNTFLPK